jgi:agmatine/peptidylarginine deiminase
MHIPAETAPQSGVMLCWPHAGTDWRDCLDAANTTYIEITRAITGREAVLVICTDREHRDAVLQMLSQAAIDDRHVHLAIAPTNDTWIRDYGPLALTDGNATRLLDFTFNGWGNKYPSGLDNASTSTLHAGGVFGDIELQSHPLVLEGGSIDVDGEGTLLTTSRCLLGSGRNPGEDRHSLEQLFGDLLGIERVLWLDHGELEGDDTDGHVDMLARFCDPGTIAYSQCLDSADKNYAELSAMETRLREFRNRDGQPYRLVALPLPRPVFDASGQRLPASYANFLVINGAVLVPVYGDPADDIACAHLASCFPGRDIVPVNCLTLIHQYGSLHCATMQLPAGVLETRHDQ